MAYTTTKSTTTTPNILASAVGLVTKTVQVDSTGIVADEYGYKTVKAGTIYPANDSTAQGIIFENVDVTHYEHTASLIVAGRIIEDRLPEELTEEAKTALNASGIVFTVEAETDRTATEE